LDSAHIGILQKADQQMANADASVHAVLKGLKLAGSSHLHTLNTEERLARARDIKMK